MRLSLTEHPEAAETTGPNRVVHELDDGRALVWELGDEAPVGALLSAPVALDDATERERSLRLGVAGHPGARHEGLHPVVVDNDRGVVVGQVVVEEVVVVFEWGGPVGP